MDVCGKRVLVVGLARSGHAAALCLERHGAIVTATDSKPPAVFQAILPSLLAQKIGIELGSQRTETFLRQDLVVISPGVPWDLPQLQAAREHGIPIAPEIEAASWFLHAPIVGVTGTNGKTTTTTLLGKMFEASGFSTFVGGNIGVPLSLAVDQVTPDSVIVAELSSFQLEAIQDFRPRVAVLLNISPNHLDRHPSFEAYSRAKRQIFRNQKEEDYAVLNADDPWVRSLAPALASHKVFFSRSQELPCGVFISNGNAVLRTGHLERVLFEKRDVHLRGSFNLDDILAAAAAACVLGADFDAVRQAVKEFKGVEHRLEYVSTIRGVEFYNNSKATSVDATVKTLEAFERGVHLILGGKDKGAPYSPLFPLLKDRVSEVLLIGTAADRIAQELSGAAELVHARNLETAVWEAFRRSRPGDVVLLAPACSSFDQFQDYEHRGRVFKDLVQQLANHVDSGPAERKRKPQGRAGQTASATDAPPAAPPREPEASSSPRVSTDNAAAVQAVAGPDVTEKPEPDVVAGDSELGDTPAREIEPPPNETACVFEVSSEELPPADVETTQDNFEGPETDASHALETTGDERLPYEARAGGKPDAASPAAEPEPSPQDSSSQPRLPGLD